MKNESKSPVSPGSSWEWLKVPFYFALFAVAVALFFAVLNAFAPFITLPPKFFLAICMGFVTVSIVALCLSSDDEVMWMTEGMSSNEVWLGTWVSGDRRKGKDRRFAERRGKESNSFKVSSKRVYWGLRKLFSMVDRRKGMERRAGSERRDARAAALTAASPANSMA